MRVSRFPCLALGALFALAIGLAGCGGGRRGGGDGIFDLDEGLPHPSDYPIHGIDVSKYQGDIDWNAVKASGVKFVWIKATEGGDHADEKFTANWAGAKSVGIPHGAYHFVYWCRPPSEEVSWFEQNVPIEDDSLPPVLDVEATPTSQTCHRHLEREFVRRSRQPHPMTERGRQAAIREAHSQRSRQPSTWPSTRGHKPEWAEPRGHFRNRSL